MEEISSEKEDEHTKTVFDMFIDQVLLDDVYIIFTALLLPLSLFFIDVTPLFNIAIQEEVSTLLFAIYFFKYTYFVIATLWTYFLFLKLYIKFVLNK